MIKIETLTKDDIGRWVEYDSGHSKKEKGRIKSWNKNWIFVVYNCDDQWERFTEFTAAATDSRMLTFMIV